MEGVLLKWTNYYNGWQPRYFVLNETGILSYYKSRELIHEGCKGSCLVLACDVKAHPHDPLRFDLIIPGEQFFCLKAKSQPERQHWLVALGSCKSKGTKSTTTTSNNDTSALVSHLSSINQELKSKVQELRLYETVLMQRIHAVKSITNDTATPDVKKFDETTSMLSVTCDAFIHTLDDCVKLATGGSTQSLIFPSPTSDNTLMRRKSSNEFYSPKTIDTKLVLPKQIVYRTFFSELHQTFSKLSPLSFNEIPSEQFLSTCEQYFHLFDKFNSTAFTPFRSDVNWNINKLRTKINNNPNKFKTLHSMIIDEIPAQKNSSINALLWLKRSADFLACFLYEFGQGDRNAEDAMNKAYGHTLKRFHGWNTRGLFSNAFRSIHSNEDFLIALAIHPNDAREVLFERQILNEMIEHSTHMNMVLRKINDFYIEYKLDSNDIVG